jgi:hypothetical protein
MLNIRDYIYVPSLRTRSSEVNAVRHLSSETKSKILPFVSLTKNLNKSLVECVNYWEEAFPHPYILDINKEKQILHSEAERFLTNSEDVTEWVKWLLELKEEHTKFIPTALYYSSVNKREYVKQIQKMNENFGLIAVKANPENKNEMRAATTAASIINKVSDIIFILDVGQVTIERQQVALRALISAINNLRNIDQSIEIVVCGSSFPSSFPQYGKESGTIPMLEWDIYHSLGGKDIAIYGDHGSIHANFYEGSFARFVARVDYPTLGKWIFERRTAPTKDNTGKKISVDRAKYYQAAAKEITLHDDWDDELDFWGVKKIEDTANGKAEKMGTPSKWIEVRVNCHIERTLSFLEKGLTSTPIYVEEDNADDEDW